MEIWLALLGLYDSLHDAQIVLFMFIFIWVKLFFLRRSFKYNYAQVFLLLSIGFFFFFNIIEKYHPFRHWLFKWEIRTEYFFVSDTLTNPIIIIILLALFFYLSKGDKMREKGLLRDILFKDSIFIFPIGVAYFIYFLSLIAGQLGILFGGMIAFTTTMYTLAILIVVNIVLNLCNKYL